MERNLTQGNLFKNIVFFSLPFLLSYFLQTLYGLADLFIAGQFNGAEIITGVSVGSQIMHMITVIIVGLAMGTTVLISRATGAGNSRQSSLAIGNTITLFMIVSVAMTAILLVFTDGIVQIMYTPPEAVEQTKIYLIICFAGIPFITAYNIISSVFRGLGDSKSPMYFIAVACVVNIILDYIFMGVLDMKSAGAAFATVIAQTVSVVFALVFIRFKNSGITVSKKDLIPDKRIMGEILKIGVPVSLQDGFVQISFMVITIIANSRGVEVAAAVGIVEKIICLLFLVPSTLLSAVSAIAAQNMGAGLHKRARLTLRYALFTAIAFGGVVSVIFQFASGWAVGLFTDDKVVIEFGTQYLMAYVFDVIFAGMHFAFSGYFCAYGFSVISFIHNIISILLVRIPGAYFMSLWYPDTLYPMGIATPAGSLLSVLICVGFYVVLRSKFAKRKYNAG